MSKKVWPTCSWPEPTEWSFDYDEDTVPMELDEDAEDLSDHINLLKLAPMDSDKDPVVEIENIIRYSFINENLLRQAFTRRAFALEYGLVGYPGHEGCSEELEFLGDAIMNTIVTREIMRQFASCNCENVAAPFECKYSEGDLTKLRMQFINKEYLASRATDLGLDKYILYGTGEEATESALEDMMEALIGAVTVDCKWNMAVLDNVVNRLLEIQLDCENDLLKKSFYEIFNSWHQKHFGRIPKYEVHPELGQRPEDGYNHYWCDIRFQVPENNKGVYTSHRMVSEGRTRSKAREHAAECAYRFIVKNGLWVDLNKANLVPDRENSINQIQELYQKKYLDEKPEYSFTEEEGDVWRCDCVCCGVCGSGQAIGKTKAKKEAAYRTLLKLMKTAGIDKQI